MTEKDQKFIARLLEDDELAWVQLTQQMTLKILRNKKHVEWLERNGHDVCEVTAELWVLLHEDNMRCVRAIKKSLVWWLRSYVEVAVRTVLDPKRRKGGGKPLPETLLPGGGTDDESETFVASIDDFSGDEDGVCRASSVGMPAPALLEEDENEEGIEWQKKVVRNVFRRFWAENPKTARALSLHLQQNLTYAEIGKMLGEKGNTIQQWIYRSKNWWIENLSLEAKMCVTNEDVDLQTFLMKYLTLKF